GKPHRREPSEFETRIRRPDDFDAFWDALLALSGRRPLNAAATPDPLRSTPEVKVYAASYDSLDSVRIAGWYCLPRRHTGRPPAVILVPGYISEPKIPKGLAAAGYAAFSAAPRGKLLSCAQFNPGYPGLLTHNIIDRNTYSYRGFYADA